MKRRDLLKAGLGVAALVLRPLGAFGGVVHPRQKPEEISFIVDEECYEACKLCYRLVCAVNADTFLGNKPGTVLFIGSHWTRRPDGRWDVKLTFGYSDAGFGLKIVDAMSGEVIATYERDKMPLSQLLKIGRMVG